MATPLLFSPMKLRELTLRNRVVISPMCQYSAVDGLADDWHFAHLTKFALGGAAIVFTEATAVEAHGRITHGDLGLWSDAHIQPLKRIADFIKAHGAVPAMQLAHAGRKASMQRPWHGNGPLDDRDRARGEEVWPIVAPSPLPMDTGWLLPHELTVDGIASLNQSWRDAAIRAREAGFEVIEVHGAHGYLIHEFLSPLSNQRKDRYGGDRNGRMRLALEIAQTVREVWPEELPMFFRVSSSDGVEGGWNVEDTIELARQLKMLGVDVLDCSSGGIAGPASAARVKRTPGFQVHYAQRIRQEAQIPTMAVGLIIEPEQAENILVQGQADLVAIGRQALFDPYWALHAEIALGSENNFASWPMQYGWWLDRRRQQIALVKERLPVDLAG